MRGFAIESSNQKFQSWRPLFKIVVRKIAMDGRKEELELQNELLGTERDIQMNPKCGNAN